jgi:hypothetical protein
MKNATKNLSWVIGSLLTGLFIAELAIRSLGSYNPDGNFMIFNRTLRPIRPPVASVKRKVEGLSSPAARTLYDPVLGWAPKPNGNSANGLYRYNSAGIRSAPSEYSPRPQKGVLRIALFGDSFTHGDEVSFEETWGFYLERELKTAGITAEVINFGVGGYGMDQAFLRWREFGYQFAPDLVIFGLQMENVRRNVNIIRPLYLATTGLPFSKPRFVFSGDRLELINSPPLPPDKLPGVIEEIAAWPLLKYDPFIRLENYRSRSWHASKFLSLAVDVVSYTPPSSRRADSLFYDLSQEPARLTLRILQDFKESVENHRSKFLMVHLPSSDALRNLLAGKTLPYARLLQRIEENHRVIHPEGRLSQEAKKSLAGLLREGGHYGARGNEVVALAIAEYLATRKDILPSNVRRSNVETL